MASARMIAVNPANTAQRYVLYGNGYIEPRGGALPVSQRESEFGVSLAPDAPTYYTALTPFGTVSEPVARIQIISWAAPSGYTLDCFGGVYEWGGATAIPGSPPPNYLFQFPVLGFVTDFYMNPAGNGQGYYLQANGDVIAFGTGTPAVAHSAFLGGPDGIPTGVWARHMIMDWTSKRYWVIDSLGRVWGKNGGSDRAVGGLPALGTFPGLDGAGVAFYDVTASAKGWMVGANGYINQVGGAQVVFGMAYDESQPYWVDLAIIDSGLGANPLRLLQLNSFGNVFEFNVSTTPKVLVVSPADPTTTTTRPTIQWSYNDAEGDAQASYQVRVINSAVYSAGGTNEVQRITITGTPTGGTFTLTFRGATTTAIAYNASTATVQAALEALTTIGTGNVLVGGGPLPGTFQTVTFQNELAAANVDQMTAAHAFTGGAGPAIAITTTTAGVGIDPAVATAVWETSGTDQLVRSVQILMDLPNTTYRAYVRATDTSGLTSDWRWQQWVQNTTPPATPTIVATPMYTPYGNRLALNVNPAGLSAFARFEVQYQDSDETAWHWVRGGYDLTPDGSGNYTLADNEPRPGIARTYRARVYIYTESTSTWLASVWSSTSAATFPSRIWILSDPADVNRALQVKVAPGLSFVHEQVAGVFNPVGRSFPVVVSDGGVKAPSFDLGVWALDTVTRAEVELMVKSGRVLLLRDPFGSSVYFKVDGAVTREMMRASPLKTELTPTRDASVYKVSCQAVARPISGRTVGPEPDTTG